MAGISPIGWVGNGLSTGLTSGVNYLGGAALDRLGGLDPMSITGPLPGVGGSDPTLMMLMQMLMGLMGNSANTGLIDPSTQQSLTDLIGGAGGGGLSAGGGGGGGGSIGGGGDAMWATHACAASSGTSCNGNVSIALAAVR